MKRKGVRYPQTIKEWPEEERPRERLVKWGAGTLSETQLLAIILGTGDHASGLSAVDLARLLLGHFETLRGIDAASITELCAVKGIGLAKATQVKAALELGRRLLAAGEGPQPQFRSSQDVFTYYHPLFVNVKQEIFKCILLDSKNRFLKEVTVSEGSLTASLVHPREVFKPAIRESAAAVIFVHNHPSGDPTPSKEDLEMTRRLVQVGEIIGIRVLDHIIVGDGRYVSFADQGLL
ncbi:MAG: JAB domain-containing protein [Nitrospinota bacterium]|nr:MAG: JAB domain-containing protein [Nitrospinota bacterium]